MRNMERPHIAAVIEDAIGKCLERRFRAFGWRNRVITYIGYGNPDTVRVLARVVLTPGRQRRTGASRRARERRGWSNFVNVVAQGCQLQVTVGDRQVTATTDRGGYLDLQVRGHGLEPGWHDVLITAHDAEPVYARVRVIGPETTIGLLSDIDDTILVTALPRPLIAAFNTFVRHQTARRAVPGMAQFYRNFLRRHPDAPVFYLSTGAWNVVPTLTRFMRRHEYPTGPMLMTDWGPTNTGWFRSGQQHKRTALRHLAGEFPQVRWLLVGDDGQHDPDLYAEFADEQPDRVTAIAIRELTPAQQVLSHGAPVPLEELTPRKDPPNTVPEIRAPDGYGLSRMFLGEPVD